MKLSTIAAVTLLFCGGLSACRKKDNPAPVVKPPANTITGKLDIHLTNMASSDTLRLGGLVPYTTPTGEQFSVSTYNYYISNIVLITATGERFAEPESYHLARAAEPASLAFTISNIPGGKYTMMEFVIGVDSVRNFSGAQTGALDPVYSMIWSWSTGYIMAKLEGTSPQSTASGKNISYHIAGYKGTYNVLRKVSMALPDAANVSDMAQPVIYISADVFAWFQAPRFKGFAATPVISTEGADASGIADNYSSMFRITKVQN